MYSIAATVIVIGIMIFLIQLYVNSLDEPDLTSPQSDDTSKIEKTSKITSNNSSNSKIQESSNQLPQKQMVISEHEIMTTKGQKHLIPLDKIKSGGPPPDGIPSIDNPKFVKADDAKFVLNSDVVIGLEINGDVRAYPLFILVWHEIVNDYVGGTPVAVTYCPLCYTNQVFERTIDGKEVEFGTSGKLYNSNLVMYDRLTGTYWSQALGLAVVGELTGTQLNIIPFDVITFGDWKKIHPDSLVLSTDTGHLRSYGVDPYGNYYTDKRIIFPVENDDNRMHPKEIILGFSEGPIHKAYKQNDLEKDVVINDKLDSLSVVLVSLYDDNARAFERTVNGHGLFFEYSDGKIIDRQTGSEWDYEGLAKSGPLQGTQLQRIPFNPGFWFEWVAFHPDTLVYGDQ